MQLSSVKTLLFVNLNIFLVSEHNLRKTIRHKLSLVGHVLEVIYCELFAQLLETVIV